jgi:hypothetical protein
MRWYDFMCPFPNQVDNIMWRPVWEWIDDLIDFGYWLIRAERKGPWE